jgi:hypothetical protein
MSSPVSVVRSIKNVSINSNIPTKESIFRSIDITGLDDHIKKLEDDIPNNLANIMTKYGSDKGGGLSNEFIFHNIRPSNQVCHNYTFFYEYLFNEYRSEKITIFEMGVGVPSCMGTWAGSLKGWKEYFYNSEIFSADFDANYLYQDERIKSFFVDQESGESIDKLWAQLPQYNFDLIIDDGPHTFTSNLLFFKKSINKLKAGGIYIIEDVDTLFIDDLYNQISSFCINDGIECDLEKLIIPWPKKFTHPYERILRMNNLIIMHKH